MSNATYLFELPFRGFHNSESWWTAFFSMLVLFLAHEDAEASIPLYAYNAENAIHRTGSFDFNGYTYSKTVIEGALRGDVFAFDIWPNEFLNLKPDITFWIPEKKKVVFVEVKTIGASIQGNASTYVALRDHMRKEGWDAHLYYLLSHGHEATNDWPVIEKSSIPFILWEDVLKLSLNTPFSHVFDEAIEQYITLPNAT